MDHINGDASDNRWANLRAATPTENNANRNLMIEHATRTNLLGIRGVQRHKRKYRARIMLKGQMIDLGLHATPEAAATAYRKAAHALFRRK